LVRSAALKIIIVVWWKMEKKKKKKKQRMSVVVMRMLRWMNGVTGEKRIRNGNVRSNESMNWGSVDREMNLKTSTNFLDYFFNYSN